MGVKVKEKIKGSGEYWIFINHKKQLKSIKVGNKKAAKDLAEVIEAKIKLNKFSFDKEKTAPMFGEYAESWLELNIKPQWKASTYRGYRDILDNHILPVFKDYKITEINRGVIKDFLLSKINDGLSRSTVSHMKDAVSGVLTKALDDEVIEFNPALQLKKVLPKGDITKSINPLEKDELKLFLDSVQENYSKHYVLILLLARTGVRIGEALALQWGDVDFNKRFIWVKKTYYQGKVTLRKTASKERLI